MTSEKVQLELKSIRQADDIYLCRSDLLIMIAKIKEMSDGEEAKVNLQALMDMVATS
jgi:hypothetical protein